MLNIIGFNDTPISRFMLKREKLLYASSFFRGSEGMDYRMNRKRDESGQNLPELIVKYGPG